VPVSGVTSAPARNHCAVYTLASKYVVTKRSRVEKYDRKELQKCEF